MKKTVSVLLSMLLIIALFSLAGCSKDKTNEPAASDQPKTSDKASSSDASELEKLFKSASKVTGVSYDMVSTVKTPQGTMNTQGKYIVSGKKLHLEMETQGMKSIVLYNGSGDTYMYTPSTNIAIKTPMPKEKPADQWAESPEDLANFKIVGHEKIDGFDCVVVTTSVNEGTMKLWLREDIGMPVRMESGDDTNKMVIEYKNFQVGAQPDSLFELPAGAQVMDMSNIQKGQMPGSLPQGVQWQQLPKGAQ